MAGLLVGGMLPFVFSALSMNAVGRAAMAMIEEVRRQFRDIPQLKAALAVMHYGKCIDISTKASIKEMVLPGLLAIAVPVAVGFLGGAEMLGGLLAGVTTCGVLMAIFQSNAGGAWDNAKKTIEEQGKKGTDAHKAAVVGDTVGDPFKDTSGPSLNILLKLMSVVALVIAPSIAMSSDNVSAYANNTNASEQVEVSKQIKVEMTNNEDGTTKAVVTTVATVNGEASTTYETFQGSEKEVRAKINALNEDGKNIKMEHKKIIKEIEEEIVN
ncbi:UNVERIFIED_CONTAM: hypothetical protein GTU68_053767 [Idotea baltica]|nr:hypothetical protein [Idotea baltica]